MVVRRADPCVAAPVEEARLLDKAALLLDFDGTLVDIAPTPQDVVVAPGLREDLARVAARMSGAVALVSGRSIDVLDALLAPLKLPAAGEHGAELRTEPDGRRVRPALPLPPVAWREAAEEWARTTAGVLFEPKHAGFVLHFRLVPDEGPRLHAALQALLAGSSTHEILQASCAWEVRPRGIDKGVAVARLMQAPPFQGRRPLFIGDDVTDEDGIAAARALGGDGMRVPECFGSAAGVRAWIARLARA